jgi:hypothetical protein
MKSPARPKAPCATPPSRPKPPGAKPADVLPPRRRLTAQRLHRRIATDRRLPSTPGPGGESACLFAKLAPIQHGPSAAFVVLAVFVSPT